MDTPPVSKHLWMDRFALKAGEVLSKATPQQAWDYAEVIFEEAGDLPPEVAAIAFAAELPPWNLHGF